MNVLLISLIEKKLLYRTERVTEMRTSHGKFCDKLLEEKKLNLKECISLMGLGLSPPERLEGMDRQLFDIINDEDGQKIDYFVESFSSSCIVRLPWSEPVFKTVNKMTTVLHPQKNP
jgi:hypothetical protein